MPDFTPTTIAFVDFEASSLAPDSWPIEVGLSWISDGQVETWSSLIRPHGLWSRDAWHEESEEVHGISLEDLSDAPFAADVAQEFLKRCEGFHLVSDAPRFDRFWMKQLLDVIDAEPLPRISDLDAVVAKLFEEQRLRAFWNVMDRAVMPHRAGPDSAAMAGAFLIAMVN